MTAGTSRPRGRIVVTRPGRPAATGSVVSGTLYVDDFLTNVPEYGQQGADEMGAIPYTYTTG